ncbi:kinesin-like protein KIN-14Q isoform X2 [Carica papaya]|nr:kinesin-like protein KIN-14Q isoform X2 [Carica papaya]
MADQDSKSEINDDVSWYNKSSEYVRTQEPGNPIDGRSVLGFSLTSPDLVICAGSPDIVRNVYGDSPELLKNKNCSVELSLENGIHGSDSKHTQKTPHVKFSSICQTFSKELSPESSFSLPPPTATKGSSENDSLPVISVNCGCTNDGVMLGSVSFSKDYCFAGGDTVRTDAIIADEEGVSLYQTARFGNSYYKFQLFEPGSYMVDLHFAEIVFTNGPPGIRVFNVYIQERKVVSSLDIYAQVGEHNPLVISDLSAFVDCEGGLSIRFEGVMGSPIICGISVRKDTEVAETLEVAEMTQGAESKLEEDTTDCMVEGDYQMLKREYECQRKELTETRRVLEELKRENQHKNKECQKTWNSLRELQDELMRKSMHVGSLAFAIEGQVKEKSKWFSSLRDLTRKLKIMRMEQIKLSEEAEASKKFLADFNKIGSIIQSRINQQADLHEDLKKKFVQGAKERKELYNKILELKGNIRVFCRCRPLNPEEVAGGASMAIDFESAKDSELTVLSNGAPRKTFKFDAVFGPQAGQADIFEDTAPFATSVLDGYNVCIFAYGQTGTGKTFTMEGTEEARGVNYRTLDELFYIIKEREKQHRYNISVSVLEVYNEQIRDLLVPGSQSGAAAKRLEIRQLGEGIHHVPGLVEAQVSNMSEVWEVLQTGSKARAVGSTNANEHSSRSHCIHCVMVKGENLLNGECTKSKLWLVDLAGSERVAKTEVQGERLKETQSINRSLSALGDVISALASKCPHVPFRNSKLTHLLQDSLGGDSKTLMFVQISPNENDLGETLCSLNFASRVRGVELGPARKQLDNTEFLRYKQMVEKSKQDMKIKDVQIKKMEDTVHGLELKIKERDLKNKNLQDKVKELESQLLIERKLARQHIDTKIAEQQQQMKQHEDQNIAPSRPPLANRLLGSNKNLNEPAYGAVMKEQVNSTRQLAENNYRTPQLASPADSLVKHIDPAEKENNPEMSEHPQLPKRTGRASICTAARRVPAAPVMRRNSLIPLPSLASLPPQFLPFSQCQVDVREGEEEGLEANCLTEQTNCDSPKGIKFSRKKLSTILRRSLQKKIQLKSPLQQHLRRGGINVGTEKVRVSIGSRGRFAHRVLLGSGRRAGTKEIQQKQNHKEKERGWNV